MINNQQDQQPGGFRQPPSVPPEYQRLLNPQQPVICPRCDSDNTKFCYYNNYSQSQPRYYCKTCKRYWTQGGTLRNIPVGGSSRKAGKRAKAGPENLGAVAADMAAIVSADPSIIPNSQAHHNRGKEPVDNFALSVGNLTARGGGGILTSFAPMLPLQYMNPPRAINQPSLQVGGAGGQFGGCGAVSNMSLLQMFNNNNVPGFTGPQPQNQQVQSQNDHIYQVTNPADQNMAPLLYPLAPSLLQPNRPPIRSSWTPSFVNNHRPPPPSNAVYWNSTTTNVSSVVPAGSSSNQNNQWPDHLPGFGSHSA